MVGVNLGMPTRELAYEKNCHAQHREHTTKEMRCEAFQREREREATQGSGEGGESVSVYKCISQEYYASKNKGTQGEEIMTLCNTIKKGRLYTGRERYSG